MESGWIEIFFLAMLAGFIGLRLYHVLGRRTGHEKPVSESYRAPRPDIDRPQEAQHSEPEPRPPLVIPDGVGAEARAGLEAIGNADPGFSVAKFLDGAEGAYRIILAAFWEGDLSSLRDFVSDEMLQDFERAIQQRNETGERLENKLLSLKGTRITSASITGLMAEVTVVFDAEISRVTRDAEGRIIAGDPDTAIEAHDIWTFSRHTASIEPTWILIATDEEG